MFHHRLCLETRTDKTCCLRQCLSCFRWREALFCPKVLGISTISQHQVNGAGGTQVQPTRAAWVPWEHCLSLARWSPPPPCAPGRLQCMCWPPCTLVRPPAPYCSRPMSPALPVFPSLQEANGPKGLTLEERGIKAQHIKTKQNKPIRNQESPRGSL